MVAVVQQRIFGMHGGIIGRIGPIVARTQQALRDRGVDVGRAPAHQFQRGIESDRNEHHHGQPNVVVGYDDNVRGVHCNHDEMQAAAGPFGRAAQNDDALLVIRNVEPHGLAAGLV